MSISLSLISFRVCDFFANQYYWFSKSQISNENNTNVFKTKPNFPRFSKRGYFNTMNSNYVNVSIDIAPLRLLMTKSHRPRNEQQQKYQTLHFVHAKYNWRLNLKMSNNFLCTKSVKEMIDSAKCSHVTKQITIGCGWSQLEPYSI